MLSQISREPRELPWQPNLEKNKPNLHKFQFCARNRGIYHIIKRFSGSMNSNMVYKISSESGWLPWQPNFGQKIALISSLQEIGKFIACTVGISELVNFNTLSEFLREPRELPWQPNLNKKSQNGTDFSPVQEIEEFFAWKIRILGRRLQICYLNFRGNQGSCHGNQIQKNISQNCTNFCFLQKIEEFFVRSVGFYGL